MTRGERQGSLDGLCGIYSVLNAVRFLAGPRRMGREHTAELFKRLIKAAYVFLVSRDEEE
jgi:hypothetical protein